VHLIHLRYILYPFSEQQKATRDGPFWQELFIILENASQKGPSLVALVALIFGKILLTKF